MLIDCDTCAVRDVHCGDCVVAAFLDQPRAAPVHLDDGEQDALSSLVQAGLVPPLRLVALPAPPGSTTDSGRDIA